MATQPTAPSPQPPPDLPSDPGMSDTMANYLRTFALWCRKMFQDKFDAHAALPGLMLSSYGSDVPNPPVYILRVTNAGVLTISPMTLGTGSIGAPVPVVVAQERIEALQVGLQAAIRRIEALEGAR